MNEQIHKYQFVTLNISRCLYAYVSIVIYVYVFPFAHAHTLSDFILLKGKR